MAVTFYEYPGCSTCRKAAKWLDEAGVAYERVHLVEKTPSQKTLKDLWQRSGLPLKKFFNTSGQSYRGGGWKEKLPELSDAAAIKGLAGDGMLIKRPILDTGDQVLVGFREAEYQEAT